MCRNIKMLFNFEPPVTDDEVRAASLQFVRKVSGFNKPSRPNEEAFQRAFQVARAQRAGAFALAAALPLARLYVGQQRFGEARAALTLALDGLVPSELLPDIEIGRAQLAATPK